MSLIKQYQRFKKFIQKMSWRYFLAVQSLFDLTRQIKSPQGLKLRGWEFTAACVLRGDVSDFSLK